jgi:hemolysin activation/secretion protein
MRLSAEWLVRERDAVFSARAMLSRGLEAFGATVNRDGTPDSRFTAALLQAQWVRRLSEAGAQLILRADAQTSNASLLPLEKFAIGGADSVRGFREGRLIRDRGWAASVEWRQPIARLSLPGLSAQPEDGRLSLAVFADAGQAWEKGGAGERLWGVGPGIRWDINPESYVQLYWAGLRRRAMQAGDNAQDKGVHFRLGLQRHF